VPLQKGVVSKRVVCYDLGVELGQERRETPVVMARFLSAAKQRTVRKSGAKK